MAITCTGTSASLAAEITLFAAGAAKALIERVEPSFMQASGHRIAATFDTVGAQRARVEKGARPDVLILSSAAIAQLSTLGLIDTASIRDIGDVQVGFAVSASNPVTPNLSTPDALRAMLLAAKSIAYADPARGATAGAHFAKVLRELGISEDIGKRVTVLPFGVEVIEAVAAGNYELGVSQSSEIVQHPSVRYVGALPAPYRLSTRYQIAALKDGATAAKDRASAASLIDFLQTPAAREASRASGFAAAQ